MNFWHSSGVWGYGCGIALYYSRRENRRPGEEYGSAKWGNPKELNRKYMDHQHKDANIILTQRVRLGMVIHFRKFHARVCPKDRVYGQTSFNHQQEHSRTVLTA